MKLNFSNFALNLFTRLFERPYRLLLIVFIWFCFLVGYFHYNSNHNGDKLAPQQPENVISKAISSLRNVPPVPYILGTDPNGPKYFKKSGCAPFPTFYDLEFSNIYWQTLRTSNGTFYFYGAYFDDRERNLKGPTIRILSMMDRIEPSVKTHCQIWFQGEEKPIFAKMQGYGFMWHKKWGNYKQGVLQPYMLSCVVPRSHFGQTPDSVSIVEHRCDAAKNNLRVLYNEPKQKEKFAVCVKGLDYLNEDLSIRLVEWIELLGVLGAHKIYFYEFSVHPNISKVLRYYQETGKIDVTHFTLPGHQPNEPSSRNTFLHKKIVSKRQNELIPYNDCLYRNIYNYQYIALLDIDEVIMPKKQPNWNELLIEIKQTYPRSKKPVASICFRNVYFFDDVQNEVPEFTGMPKHLHMLQHLHRSSNYSGAGRFEKCFHDTEIVTTLHNHFPRSCLTGFCRKFSVDTNTAHLQHYRKDCSRGVKQCKEHYRNNLTLDTAVLRYSEQLKNRGGKVLHELKLIGE